ncbi:MAG: hypothetical protein RBT64_12615 [Trichloromonas sp.]|nr:hypothetical protein [Trichloromonas sp.]
MAEPRQNRVQTPWPALSALLLPGEKELPLTEIPLAGEELYAMGGLGQEAPLCP